jgi:hypothetical protein
VRPSNLAALGGTTLGEAGEGGVWKSQPGKTARKTDATTLSLPAPPAPPPRPLLTLLLLALPPALGSAAAVAGAACRSTVQVNSQSSRPTVWWPGVKAPSSASACSSA